MTSIWPRRLASHTQNRNHWKTKFMRILCQIVLTWWTFFGPSERRYRWTVTRVNWIVNNSRHKHDWIARKWTVVKSFPAVDSKIFYWLMFECAVKEFLFLFKNHAIRFSVFFCVIFLVIIRRYCRKISISYRRRWLAFIQQCPSIRGSLFLRLGEWMGIPTDRYPARLGKEIHGFLMLKCLWLMPT